MLAIQHNHFSMLPNELIYIICEFLSVEDIFAMRLINKLMSKLLFGLIFEKITFNYSKLDKFGKISLKHNIVFPGNITHTCFKYFYKNNEKSDEYVKYYYPNVNLIDSNKLKIFGVNLNMLRIMSGFAGMRYST